MVNSTSFSPVLFQLKVTCIMKSQSRFFFFFFLPVICELCLALTWLHGWQDVTDHVANSSLSIGWLDVTDRVANSSLSIYTQTKNPDNCRGDRCGNRKGKWPWAWCSATTSPSNQVSICIVQHELTSSSITHEESPADVPVSDDVSGYCKTALTSRAITFIPSSGKLKVASENYRQEDLLIYWKGFAAWSSAVSENRYRFEDLDFKTMCRMD